MRKLILKVSLALAITTGAGWAISQNVQEVKLSDLTLDNVEALARCEPYYGGSCWLTRDYQCCVGGGVGCAPCD